MSQQQTASDQLPTLLAAAGLVHDLGKVLEPAGEHLDERQQGLEGQICPTTRDGRATHRHVLFTAKILDELDEATNWGGLDRQELFRIACNHHRPSSGKVLEHILTHADRLASGHDRQAALQEREQRVTGLVSPFSLFFGENDPEAAQIVPIAADRFAPEGVLPAEERTTAQYRDKCRELSACLRRELAADYEDPDWCIERVQAVMRHYLSAVPASRAWKERPDTSLYDHSRIVAAFAAALGAQHATEPFQDESSIQGRYGLVSVRLKGLQSFIARSQPPVDTAGGTAKGRAKTLRARSFYVSLLSRSISQTILERLGLPITNVVLDAGGHTTLLVHDTEGARRNRDEALGEARDWILEHLGGTIRLEVGVLDDLTDQDFQGEKFSQTLRNLEDAASRSSHHFIADGFRHDNAWATGEQWIGSSSGLPIDSGSLPETMKKLGEKLPKIEAIRFQQGADSEGEISVPNGSVKLIESTTGEAGTLRVALSESGTHPTLPAAAYIPRASEADADADDAEGGDALREGQPLTFDRLAARPTTVEALKGEPVMLGALKADVDHLGHLFAYGFSSGERGSSDRASLGRLAGTSRMLDDFFKGFLDARLRTEFSSIYTVFAGGDDLFLIGPWIDILVLVRKLHEWFGRFACGHPRVTLSAGVTILKPHAPVRIIAEECERQLKNAKERRNRIAVFSSVMQWGEYGRAWRWHEQLMDLYLDQEQERRPPVALLRTLFQAAESARRVRAHRESREPISLNRLKWRSQLQYQFKRAIGRNQDAASDERFDELPLFKELVGIGDDDAEVLRVASMITMYRMRGGGHE